MVRKIASKKKCVNCRARTLNKRITLRQSIEMRSLKSKTGGFKKIQGIPEAMK
jgi:hypothetical protein